jgi:hypothetical protein
LAYATSDAASRSHGHGLLSHGIVFIRRGLYQSPVFAGMRFRRRSGIPGARGAG